MWQDAGSEQLLQQRACHVLLCSKLQGMLFIIDPIDAGQTWSHVLSPCLLCLCGLSWPQRAAANDISNLFANAAIAGQHSAGHEVKGAA